MDRLKPQPEALREDHHERARAAYDAGAARWVRRGPLCLSDFTGRPPVLELCAPIADAIVLDLGCGEGYVARLLKERGAASVLGIDLSAEMIRRALEVEAEARQGIEYRIGSATELGGIAAGSFDLVIAVFLLNYLTIEQTHAVTKEAFRLLRPGGRFVFSVPHPSLAFLREHQAPFYFDPAACGYFSARDRMLEGKIWRRDGVSLDVRSIHKTLQDYLDGLRGAGFRGLPDFQELGVTDEHLQLDPEFFGPIADTPLHLVVRTVKPT